MKLTQVLSCKDSHQSARALESNLDKKVTEYLIAAGKHILVYRLKQACKVKVSGTGLLLAHSHAHEQLETHLCMSVLL